MYNLKSLGWSEFFESEFQPYRERGYFAGRVVLCQENVGLLPAHVEPLLAALRQPLGPRRPADN